MNLEVTVIDDCAPSDKYPHMGVSIDFKDINGITYYAEYPNYKSLPFEFIKGKKYNFDCSTNSDFSITYMKKISRIKNIKEIYDIS